METPVELTADRVEGSIAAAVEALTSKAGITNVYFAACGGSYALMIPLQHIVESTSSLPVQAHNAREFTTRAPKALGPGSVVIVCSHSGDTPETVEAARYGRERGALTIALTHRLDSPLAEAAEYVVGYQHGEDKLYAYTAAPLLYRLVHGLVDAVEGTQTLAAATEATHHLDALVADLHAEHFDRADAWAKAHARSSLIYTMGSGPNYGTAYAFAICLLQEMLWVHSQGINGAEYFHGPFEITDHDVPFLELLGLGATRPIDERAHNFVTSQSDDVLTLDAGTWDLSAIPEALRPSFAHLVFSPLLRLYAERLADHRGHPLTVRRYMWRMAY